MYSHPFDPVLQQLGWARQTFDKLPSREDLKVPVVLLVITPPNTTGGKYAATIVNLRLWQKQRKVRTELVSKAVPATLEPMLISGIVGVRSVALGLAPCPCKGDVRRWQPYILPLVPHKTMTPERLRPAIGRYIDQVRIPNWACQVPSHLMP